MSNDRQLRLCISGQSLLLLIACHFEGNHQLFPWDSEERDSRQLSSEVGILWPVIYLPSYSLGLKRVRSLNKTETELSYILCPQVRWL